MTSKRLRYEILRRDNHSCRYCGGSAPEVKLTVDHVIPKALGGGDEPTNLVAACIDCNAGKTSTPPDAPIVDDVRQSALIWGRAVEAWNAIQAVKRAEHSAYADAVDEAWRYWSGCDDAIPRPPNWHTSALQFHRSGLPVDEVVEAIRIAMGTRSVRHENVWRYTCGIVWRKIEQMNEGAMALLAEASSGNDPFDPQTASPPDDALGGESVIH